MSEPYFQYWVDAVEAALNDMGKLNDFTSEQIEQLAGCMEGAHDNIGQAFYVPSGPSQAEREKERLDHELRVERSKIVCPECKGRGSITEVFGPIGRSATGRCEKCNGEGKITP